MWSPQQKKKSEKLSVNIRWRKATLSDVTCVLTSFLVNCVMNVVKCRLYRPFWIKPRQLGESGSSKFRTKRTNVLVFILNLSLRNESKELSRNSMTQSNNGVTLGTHFRLCKHCRKKGWRPDWKPSADVQQQWRHFQRVIKCSAIWFITNCIDIKRPTTKITLTLCICRNYRLLWAHKKFNLISLGVLRDFFKNRSPLNAFCCSGMNLCCEERLFMF